LTLSALLERVNPILRGWADYFRHGVSKATFSYLDTFAWRRVVSWLRHKHHRRNWSWLRRHHLPRWRPTEGKVTLFNLAKVTVSRYRYRGTRIPTERGPPGRASRNRSSPDQRHRPVESRPERVSLIFDRQIRTRGPRPTPTRFRTRVFTPGVTPSLNLEYRHRRIKQYHKEGRRALRTEMTFNDTRDFGIGRRLCNLPALREVPANRRLLDVQTISHDPIIGDTVFNQLNQPAVIDGRRVAGLRFGDLRVHALLGAVVICRVQPDGFANFHLRQHVAQLLGVQTRPAQRRA
jgi:hypothetical protein